MGFQKHGGFLSEKIFVSSFVSTRFRLIRSKLLPPVLGFRKPLKVRRKAKINYAWDLTHVAS